MLFSDSPRLRTETTSFRHDKATKQMLEDLSKWEGRSTSNMLVRLIHREFNKQKRRRQNDKKR